MTVNNQQLTITNEQSLVVSGAVVDSTSVTVTVNGQNVPITNGAFSTTVNLIEGTNTITITATNAAGNSTTLVRQVTLYTAGPKLTVTSPSDSLITNNSQVQLSGTVSDSLAATVQVNGNSVPVTNGSFSSTISLVEGMNTITIVATDAAGNKTTVTKTVELYTIVPVLVIASPTDNLITKDTAITVWGTVTDSTGVTVTVNGINVPVNPDTFKTTVNLVEGLNTITIAATDGAGNSTTATRAVRRETTAPTITISSPQDSMVTNQSAIQISGTVSDSTSVTLTVNGQNVSVSNGSFSTTVNLVEGNNTVIIVATDAAGNSTTITRTVRLYAVSPVITFQSPQNSATINDSTVTVSGTVQDSTNATVTVDGNAANVNPDGSFSIKIPLAVGANQITISITDAAGNTSSNQVSVTRSGIILPPDPSTVAPKIDPTVVTTVGAATSFLYTGSHPIQTSVDTSMMSYVRAAAIRGRVLSRDNQPLPGATVSILNHPEFGQTLSRADGMYDMAINGGGQLTVNYSMTGYLTAQRQVNTPWQSYAHIDSVVLVQLDPNVTVVKLGGDSISVARGSVVTDQDGTRQATIMFKPGTQATMKIVHYTYDTLTSGGSTRLVKMATDTASVPMSTLSVRATEYTVGSDGPQAMPADLPPSSAYTYCVELSSDEAVAAGANTVDFNEPVVNYVDNFLNCPVGSSVPVGWYDRSKGQWVAMLDGVVIEILDTTGGVASIDLHGSGVAASRASLDSVGIDSAEQMKLAGLYSPGQTLWRMPVTHFSIWDYNFLYVLVGAGTTDNLNFSTRNQTPVGTTCQVGSIIGAQNQSLGQSLSITGTPFTMYYNSCNTAGSKQANLLNLPITGGTLPTGLVGTRLIVNVAGQESDQRPGNSPNTVNQYVWDGKDAFGRTLQGEYPVDVSIGYIYNVKRIEIPHEAGEQEFALNEVGVPGSSFTGSTVDNTRWTYWHSTIGKCDIASEKLGEWSLDIHHRYDATGEKIYYGNGEARDASLIGPVLTNVQQISDGDFEWGSPHIAIAPDGTIYISELLKAQVWKRCVDGSMVLVAGTGSEGYSGDGGPATSAKLFQPMGITLGPDGSLYIADEINNCIRRVNPFGIISTYAGTGTEGFSGDGGPAVNAQLYYPMGVAVGPDGSLYIADEHNSRVRMVNPAGIITTVAGDGTFGFGGDGGPASQSKLNGPCGLDVDAQGDVYIADYGNNRIRMISPAGIITTIAGSLSTAKGDGGPAINAKIGPTGVTVGRDGSVYIDEYYGLDIRVVGADGIISTYVGGSNTLGEANDGLCHMPSSSAIGPDGSLYFAEDYEARGSSMGIPYVYYYKTIIHEVTPAFPGISETETSIASEDGSEVYVFDDGGKHLETLDALTNARLYSFTYDSLGLLTAVTDRDSLVTTIQRDANGNPLAIVSPYGQRTVLNVDTTGYLTSAIDPAGDTTRYTYSPDGLMTSLKDPRGNTHDFAYDSLGRLIMDQDPAGGYKILTRTDNSNGYSVAVQTALGNKTVYGVSALPTGGQLMTTTDASGLTDTTTYDLEGTWYTRTHDGITTQTIQGPDPRFGMQSPVNTSVTTTTPGGIKSATTDNRTVTLMSGLQVTGLKDSVVVNGKVYQTLYNGIQHLFTTTSPLGRQSFTYIDTLGRVIKDSIPGIVPVNYYYDRKGRLTSVAQGARISYFTYDSLGRISLAKDPIGNTSGFAYDSVGRVTVQTLPDGNIIAFTYDANGNLITLTPPSRPEHMFDYNVNDLTDKYIAPSIWDSLGTPNPDTTNLEPRTTNYSYDLDKRLVTTNLPDGRTITITYDTAGCGCGGTADRLHSIAFDRGTQTFAYDAKGNLAQTISPSGDTLLYGYDGSLPTSVTWKGTVKGSVGVTYDNNFNVTSQTVNGGNKISFGYDNDGLLTNVGSMTLSYNPQNGLLTGTTLGNVTTSQTYSTFGELSSYTANYSSSPIFQTSYVRDSLGRITTLNETIQGVSKSMQYSYDPVGRLQNVWRNDTLVSTYRYDPNGNRIAHITPTSIDSGTYDAQDRMLSVACTRMLQSSAGAQYVYGLNGDLQAKISGSDTTEYTYDALGNLTQVVMPNGDVIQYVIDGQNRRIAKKVNGKIVDRWIYSGQLSPVAELDSAGNVVAQFVGSYMIQGGTTYQLVTDHLGSVRLVVNISTGAIAERIDYDEFGNVAYDSNPGFQPYGFAGGLYDTETKLVRFGARDYDASTGRWTSKDPILFKGGVSNLYEYVVNDPVNRFDLSGLQETFGQWLSNILGYQPDEAQAEAQAEYGSSCPNAPTQQQLDQAQFQTVSNFTYGLSLAEVKATQLYFGGLSIVASGGAGLAFGMAGNATGYVYNALTGQDQTMTYISTGLSITTYSVDYAPIGRTVGAGKLLYNYYILYHQ